MTPLRHAIRSAMQSRGLTFYQLEQMSGVNRGHISRYLRGKKGLRDDCIEALMLALALEVVDTRE